MHRTVYTITIESPQPFDPGNAHPELGDLEALARAADEQGATVTVRQAPDLAAERVWVLSIEDRYGTNLSVHRSEEDGRAALRAFVVQAWEQDRPGQPMPDDENRAVRRFFEQGEEHYTLDEVTLQGPSRPAVGFAVLEYGEGEAVAVVYTGFTAETEAGAWGRAHHRSFPDGWDVVAVRHKANFTLDATDEDR
jgi:hypothetical protein